MQDVFLLEPRTEIPAADAYIRSYPHLIQGLPAGQAVDVGGFVRLAHIVYGWMPTILELHGLDDTPGFGAAVQVLQRARDGSALSAADIERLAAAVNRSVVGASKLLHFAAPAHFPIWDSRIYRFTHDGAEPWHSRVNRVSAYRAYIGVLQRLQQDLRFPAFHASMERKLGYAVTPMRSLELVMFLHGKRPDAEDPYGRRHRSRAPLRSAP